MQVTLDRANGDLASRLDVTRLPKAYSVDVA